MTLIEAYKKGEKIDILCLSNLSDKDSCDLNESQIKEWKEYLEKGGGEVEYKYFSIKD